MKDLIRLMDPKYIECLGQIYAARRHLDRPVLQLRQARHPLGGRLHSSVSPTTICTRRRWTTDERKAMVPCSGGVDSTTCLWPLAIEKHGKGECVRLSIYYGQKHVKEIQAAKAVLEYYGIEGTSLDLTPVFAYSDCSLLSHSDRGHPRGNPTPSSWRSAAASRLRPMCRSATVCSCRQRQALRCPRTAA